ncbi:hypothetical protein F4781DRAFT_434755 [Annulohypoxylon bovei var. microspora]|nr:hypothetical protein F4781DRAFT_434755 [Annulohypoxylon bovei var. microspora]
MEELDSSNQHNYDDWESSALGPADLFSSFGDSMIPPIQDWSLGLDNGSNITEVDWSLPGLDGVGDPLVFENNMRNGHLDASGILSGYEPNLDFQFNQPLNSHNPPGSGSDTGPSDKSYSPPAMPKSPGASSSRGQTPKSRRSPMVDPVTALKRQRNNVAARKYRQKRIDRITELEMELQGVKDERDDLRLRLARQEAEAAALRSMLQLNSGKGARG